MISSLHSIPFLISLVITITHQQQCPIGHLSFNAQKCYFTISSTRNYFDAENDCKTRAVNVGVGRDSAYLVSIGTAFENANVLASATDDASNCTEYFIGANNIANGAWQWSDGTMFGYTNWNTGCPSGSNQCTTMNANGQWCNRNCAAYYCYICEIVLGASVSTAPTMSISAATSAPSCNTNYLDIVVILHSYDSQLDWNKVRMFIINSLLPAFAFDMGSTADRIPRLAYIVYHEDTVHEWFTFGVYNTIAAYANAIQAEPFHQTESSVPQRLSLSYQSAITQLRARGRPYARRAVVVITDFIDNANDASGMASGYATLRDELQALVLGVGTTATLNFVGIANQSFSVPNVDALSSAPQASALVNSVQMAICAIPPPSVRPPCANFADIVVILHSFGSQIEWNKVRMFIINSLLPAFGFDTGMPTDRLARLAYIVYHEDAIHNWFTFGIYDSSAGYAAAIQAEPYHQTENSVPQRLSLAYQSAINQLRIGARPYASRAVVVITDSTDLTNDATGMMSGYSTLRNELRATVIGVGTSPTINFTGFTDQAFRVANVDALASSADLVNSLQMAVCASPPPV